MNDRTNQRTETDERVEENRGGAPVAPVSRDASNDVDPATGLPRGVHDAPSPLDRGQNLDPFRGKSPAERVGKMPGESQEQAFGSVAQHEADRE